MKKTWFSINFFLFLWPTDQSEILVMLCWYNNFEMLDQGGMSMIHYFFNFYAPSETGLIMWLGMAGGHPHRFPHNNFSSVYRIFTKLSHMIPLWKGKNPIYFGVIRSKVKVTVTINRIFDRLIIYIDGRILLLSI